MTDLKIHWRAWLSMMGSLAGRRGRGAGLSGRSALPSDDGWNAARKRIGMGIWLCLGGAAWAGTLPTITDFSPALGQPGTTVVINGQNLGAASAVTFNGTPSGSVANTASTQVHATVPIGATTGPIVVRTSAGFAVSADPFVVLGSGPYITDFSPTLGPPGAAVTIDGVNFNNVTAVKFNGTNASFAVIGATQLSAQVPTNATTGPITVVTTAGTQTTLSNFVAVGYGPYITGFSGDSGLPGDPVVVSGLNFTHVTAVKFNGMIAAYSVVGETQINATVPPNATTGPITVATTVGTNVSAVVFVVGHAPVISDFAPTNGVAGNLVVINGANLSGSTAIRFNGTNALFFAITADTQISVQVPSGAVTGPITVVTPDGTNTSAAAFTVLQPPVITALTPSNGPPTTTIRISGTNFIGATDVLFNGAGSIFTVDSITNLTATVPPTAASGPVLVVTPAGVAVSPSNFTVTTPTGPTVTGFSPLGGPPGTAVAIAGSQFINVIAVKFNGVNASSTTVSPTEIDAIVPTGATTGPLTVTTVAGTATSANAFVVGPAPVFTSFSPTNSLAGASVVITGANFIGATSVQFNGVPAVFQVISSVQLQAQVPSTALSGPITIVTPTGTVVSSADFFVIRLADLVLQQTVSTTQANLGAVLTNTFTVVNTGPSDATGVTFTNVLPPGVNFTAATATQGVVSRTNNVVACAVGSLPVHGGALVTVAMQPTVVGVITNFGVVTANELDANPANRLAKVVVTMLPPVLTIRPIAPRSLEIGWPGAAVGFKLQVTPQLQSNVWAEVTSPPVLTGGRYLVTNPVSGGAGDYRLRLTP